MKEKIDNQSQYNRISSEYKLLTETDPSKMFVQYPSALRLLGDISNKYILDVGCGNGIFDQELLKNGAIITGYDISEEQIIKAKQREKNNQKLAYFVSSPSSFHSEIHFDKAVSIMVLPYAKNIEELESFFKNTFNNLKISSSFISIVFNPNYKRLGTIVYNRRFTEIGNKIKVEFINLQNNTTFSAIFSKFSKDDYEQSSKKAGFSNVRWEELTINPEGKELINPEFWKGYEEDCPYIGFIVSK